MATGTGTGTRTLVAAAVAALVLLAGCTGAGTPSVAAQSGSTDADDTTPTVTVGASATVEAAPDLAVVRVTVEATAESAEAARAAVAEDADRMRAALRDAGVPDADVSTEAFNVYPEYDYSGESRELVGYRAVHAYRIEAAPDRAGEVIDVAVGNGATSVAGVSFTLSEATRDELRGEALSAAVENARTDAETVASAAGTSLGDVRSISTSGDGGVGPVPVYETRNDAGGSTVVEPGTVRVSASVSVVYELA
jgi:uncharacterized protein YggE